MPEMWRQVILIDTFCPPGSPVREIPLFSFWFLREMRKSAVEQIFKELREKGILGVEKEGSI